MRCRHCHPQPFTESYASVALLGTESLEHAVERLEGRGIVPCLTAVCGACNKLSAILYDVEEPYLHTLVLYEHLGHYLAL